MKKRQYTVYVFVEEQDLDEEGDLDDFDEATEPESFRSFDTLAEAEAFITQLRTKANLLTGGHPAWV